MATARSERRAKEVGIRKSLGSGKKQLISQFLSESIFVTCAKYNVVNAKILR
ncbi:MAG: FtsX-like permease family protein [Cyanobacteria bacterium P01_A01_bin.45]